MFMLIIVFIASSALAAETLIHKVNRDAVDVMAALINLDDHLCADVIGVYKLNQPDIYEVECIEYRGGNGRADYLVNLKTGDGHPQGSRSSHLG
ncbi:hypothetical protein [Desulfocurvibacter africanus]|uniref:hypothetical protein n=1 Tax=Desulfocurvibacter africanus TaxID=873 RepID=UPI001267FAE3|nr:hypothetical protein [Desulfocurvibacter africanus]